MGSGSPEVSVQIVKYVDIKSSGSILFGHPERAGVEPRSPRGRDPITCGAGLGRAQEDIENLRGQFAERDEGIRALREKLAAKVHQASLAGESARATTAPAASVVHDVMRGWKSSRTATADLQRVVEEICTILRSYRISSVSGDGYAAQWVQQAFQRCGVRYELVSDKARTVTPAGTAPPVVSSPRTPTRHGGRSVGMVGVMRS